MNKREQKQEEQEKKEREFRKKVNDNGGFEKKDIPALIISALLTFLPVCLVILLTIYFLAKLLMGM